MELAFYDVMEFIEDAGFDVLPDYTYVCCALVSNKSCTDMTDIESFSLSSA